MSQESENEWKVRAMRADKNYVEETRLINSLGADNWIIDYPVEVIVEFLTAIAEHDRLLAEHDEVLATDRLAIRDDSAMRTIITALGIPEEGPNCCRDWLFDKRRDLMDEAGPERWQLRAAMSLWLTWVQVEAAKIRAEKASPA